MSEKILLAGVILENALGKIALQLRDENPNIINPGLWSIFGGHIEDGESPDITAKREMQEELSITIGLDKLSLLGKFGHKNKEFYVFHYLVVNEMDTVILKEGQDWRWCSTEEILGGEILGFKVVDYHIEFIKQFRAGKI